MPRPAACLTRPQGLSRGLHWRVLMVVVWRAPIQLTLRVGVHRALRVSRGRDSGAGRALGRFEAAWVNRACSAPIGVFPHPEALLRGRSRGSQGPPNGTTPFMTMLETDLPWLFGRRGTSCSLHGDRCLLCRRPLKHFGRVTSSVSIAMVSSRCAAAARAGLTRRKARRFAARSGSWPVDGPQRSGVVGSNDRGAAWIAGVVRGDTAASTAPVLPKQPGHASACALPVHPSHRGPSSPSPDTSESSPSALRRPTRCRRSTSVWPFSYAPDSQYTQISLESSASCLVRCATW